LEKGDMTETSKKNAPAKFEYISEGMPRLSAETPAPVAEQAALETGKSEVRSVRVLKLDQHTVWRVIEVLKSL
jgi:hypothetical protein